MIAAPSPEFAFVCAACQWPRDRRDPAVRAAAVAGLDWQRVLAITRRHRVAGLVADAVTSAGIAVPEQIGTELRDQGARIARKNLVATGETLRIGVLLDAAGIAWISFKGLPLAIRAYGTLSVKQSNDIDLLIAPDRAVDACRLLAAAGYVRFNPGPEIADDKLATWLRAAKEVGWKHPATGTIVEVHERMTANPALFPEPALDATHIELAAGRSVPTIREELLFPYLAAHGARDAWFRLKWLADVAALLSGSDVEAAYRNAQRLGVGRCAAQALLLANRLFALPLDPELKRELTANPIHRLLVRVALRSVGGDYEVNEPSRRSMVPAQAANLLLRRGFSYKWHELAALAANPRDRAKGMLPRWLGFLYPVLGGMRWGGRMLGLKGAMTRLSKGARIKSILGGSAGNLVEWYDWYAYAVLATYLAPHYFPDNASKDLNAWAVFAVGFFMRPIGGWLMGIYGDRRGRKAGLTLSVTLMCAGSLIIALSPGYETIGWGATVALIAARLLQGLSLGGEYGASATYLSEMAERRHRGFYSSFQYVTLISGQLVALVVLMGLQAVMGPAELKSWGWRIPFAVGGLLALLVYWLRRRLPETESFEKRDTARKASVGALFTQHPREAAIVMLLTAGGTLAFYAYTIYPLVFLKKTAGFSDAAATQVNAAALFVFACIQPLAGALSDRIGRKPLMIGFGVLGLLLSYPIFVALEGVRDGMTAFLLMTGALVIVTGYTSINAVVKAELFPAHIRTLGVALPYALANSIFGGLAPWVALQFKSAGWERGFYWYVTAMIGVSLATYITMRDTQRESMILED